jgi:hypothetical protein
VTALPSPTTWVVNGRPLRTGVLAVRNIANVRIRSARHPGKFNNLLKPIVGYTISTVLLGPNILRDSILTRLENLHYEAYVHCCACMWKRLFKELRGLTNTTNMSNPVELNDLYDHMWNVGLILQSDEPLVVLAVDFRPWPRFRANEARSQSFYETLERNKKSDLTELRRFETSEDLDIYRPILIEILNLFGIAIHTLLERTLGHYLKATDGMYRNELRDDWQLEKVSALLCTNNPAERPFAVAKAYMNIHQRSES